jgi:N-acetylglucosaminyldiphosphoundecaprenol N-acetyl-beta-D-mannosaminyltransferase
LGVNVSCVDEPTVLNLVKTWCQQSTLRTVFYVNAHCINISVEDNRYREILNQADLVYPDGIGVVWASFLLNGCQLEKITGRDWIEDFCSMANDNGFSIYILAGKPGIAQKAKKNLLKKTSQLQIIGTHNGYLSSKESIDIIEDINKKSPDVLLVGMGAPIQEIWIYRNRKQLKVPVCWAVGAMFDYVAGIEPPVPPLLNAMALEWLWRLLLDPRHKWKRYVLGIPKFLYRLIHQVISVRFNLRKK